jgi:hypothetical protein
MIVGLHYSGGGADATVPPDAMIAAIPRLPK